MTKAVSAKSIIGEWLIDRDVVFTPAGGEMVAEYMLKRLNDAGYVIAPKEPTEGDMGARNYGEYEDFMRMYRAMLTASQDTQ